MANGIRRTVEIGEVGSPNAYPELAELCRILHHEVVEEYSGVWRFKRSRLIQHIQEQGTFYEGEYRHKSVKGSLDLNALWCDFHRRIFDVEELMKFYMDLGYSLSGFMEVFGQHEAEDWKLPGAIPSEGGDEYTQTPIAWVIAKHKRD